MQFRGKFHPHLDSYPRHHINQNQRLAKKRHLLVAFMIQGAWELRELTLNRGDIGKSWQSCFVSEVLDFVSGSGAGEAEMLLPTFRGIGEIGVDISAVENIASPTRIENTIRRHNKSWKCSNSTCLIVPEQATLAERHATNFAAPTLEIVEHSCRLELHLLAKALGYDRDVDEGKELMRV